MSHNGFVGSTWEYCYTYKVDKYNVMMAFVYTGCIKKKVIELLRAIESELLCV